MDTTFADDMKLEARALACHRGGRRVFEGMSFMLRAGQYLSLRGRNGSGKSTLLRLLAGFVPPREGTLRVESGGAEMLISDVALMVGHLNGLKPQFSLRQNIDHFCTVMTGHKADTEKLVDAAEQFGLAALLSEPVQYFSSGQRHRSALMRLLLVPRQIWLMDEPTVGLDTENRTALERVMQGHLAMGGIIVAASHDPIAVEGATLNLDDHQPQSQVSEEWL